MTSRILKSAAIVIGGVCAARAPALTPALPDPLAAGWEGASVCELLHEDQAQRVLRCTFPPGVGHERHYHPPHFGYALTASTMRITDADGSREQSIPAGAHWVSDGIAWHEVLNIGATTGVYLVVEPK